MMLSIRFLLCVLGLLRGRGAARKAVVKEFKGIAVSGDLVVGLEPCDTSRIKKPVVCGIEADREDARR